MVAVDPGVLHTWGVTETVLLLLLAPLLVVSALFSGSETALFGLQARDRHVLAARGHRGDRAALALLTQPRQLLITILLGNMVANVGWFTIVAILAGEQPWGLPGAIAVQVLGVLCIVLFGEVVPKVMASSAPAVAAGRLAISLQWLHVSIAPLRHSMERFLVRPLARLAGHRPEAAQLTGADLGALLDHQASAGVVDVSERQQLEGILSLSQRPVRSVMTPRTRMVSISLDDTPDVIATAFRTSALMRLPVFGKDADEIKGMLHARDWIHAKQPADFIDLCRSAAFVPSVAAVDRVMSTLRSQGRKTAIVVDEFGGTAGIVSMRDLVEPLTGDFEDADAALHEVRPLGPDRWVVDGDHHATALLGLLDQHDQSNPTFADLVQRTHGKPSEGDEVVLGNVRIQVHHVDENGSIETLLVSRFGASDA
jgi:putative hemolysin